MKIYRSKIDRWFIIVLAISSHFLLVWIMCAEKTGGFNLVNYRYSLEVYHEKKAKNLY